MRFVRSPNLCAHWGRGGFVLEEFAKRERISVAPIVVELLDLFSRPQPIELVARGFPPFSPRSVERQLHRLIRLGFLVRADGKTTLCNLSAAWRDSFAAAYFHFATREVHYLTDSQEEERYLRKRLAQELLPPQFKAYRRKPGVGLSRPTAQPAASLEEALSRRRTAREFRPLKVPFADLSAIVRGTWGRTGWLPPGILGRSITKTSPSAGARHPIECYLLAWRVANLRPGLYHYNVRNDRLERLAGGDFRNRAVRMAAGQGWIAAAGFLCVMTAVADRVFWKYASADAYRLFLLDAGHLAQTFVLLATARGLGSFTTAALNEGLIERTLGIDGVTEFPVYLCGAGSPLLTDRDRAPRRRLRASGPPPSSPGPRRRASRRYPAY